MISHPNDHLDNLMRESWTPDDLSRLTQHQASTLLQMIGVKSMLAEQLLSTGKTISWPSLCEKLLDELFDHKDWISDHFNSSLLHDEQCDFETFMYQNIIKFDSLGLGIVRHAFQLPTWIIRDALRLPPPTPEDMYISICRNCSDTRMIISDIVSFYACSSSITSLTFIYMVTVPLCFTLSDNVVEDITYDKKKKQWKCAKLSETKCTLKEMYMALAEQPSSEKPPSDWLSHFTCIEIPIQEAEAWAIKDLVVKQIKNYSSAIRWCDCKEDGTFEMEVNDSFDRSREQKFVPIEIRYPTNVPDEWRYELCNHCP